MNPYTRSRHEIGQRPWLDVTRKLLRSSTLARSISDLSVTGLISNPTTERPQPQTAQALQ